MGLRRIWREVRLDYADRVGTAAAIALGVYIANLPTYPCQTLLSIYAGKRLHLNPLVVVLGSHITTPPLGWALIALAASVGHLMLHGQWLSARGVYQGLVANGQTWSTAWQLLVDWIVGSFIVGAVLALAAFFVTLAIMRLVHAIRKPKGPATS